VRKPYERERDDREAYTTRRPRRRRSAPPDPPATGEPGLRLSPRDLTPLGPLVKRIAERVKPEVEK
jgi:hypothetical protein